MMNRIIAISLIAAGLVAHSTRLYAESAQITSGTTRVGYLYVDEAGNNGVDYGSFNLQEGVAVSLENFAMRWDGGLRLRANLKNMSLDNRQQTLSLYKRGLFSLNLRHSKYQREYDFEGDRAVRGWRTAGELSFNPFKYVKVFAGIKRLDRKGSTVSVPETGADTIAAEVDYVHSSYHFGTVIRDKHGSVRVDYRLADFENKLNSVRDRETSALRIAISSTVPGYKKIRLDGGYHYRQDELLATSTKLTTKLGWASTRVSLPKHWTVSYKFSFGRTEHTGQSVEIDNVVNTFTAGRIWKRVLGLKAGYENRISDDLLDRTVSQGFLADAWFKRSAWTVRGHLALRDKEVKTGATLTGDENLTRHSLSANYRAPKWGEVTWSWKGRTLKHDPDFQISDTLTPGLFRTRVDYDSYSAVTRITSERYGTATFSYTYYLGKYQNNSSAVVYQFSDNLLVGRFSPVQKGKLSLEIGGTYYRSRRDTNIEKFTVAFGGEYRFSNGYAFSAKYDALNFDDLTVSDRYYTGNIVEISISKDLKR